MYILDYFESLQRSIQQNRSVISIEEPMTRQAFDAYRGLFRVRISFWDESHLTIDEIIDTGAGYPEILRYAYTYVKNDAHIFRYDNAPHYPNFPTFPYHKHVGPGEVPQASEKPTLAQVFKEIDGILAVNE
jgi:hypothetical protein